MNFGGVTDTAETTTTENTEIPMGSVTPLRLTVAPIFKKILMFYILVKNICKNKNVLKNKNFRENFCKSKKFLFMRKFLLSPMFLLLFLCSRGLPPKTKIFQLIFR
jgi:hypothetical protein